MKTSSLFFFIVIGVSAMVSCQKEIDGLAIGTVSPFPADQKPKVGTTWTYRYEWKNSPGSGGSVSSKTIHHKAISEETLGGEKWLKIVDVEADTTVYFLNTKIDGLYQYTNNNPYLLCKYPAAINDTYTTFNSGSVEDFTVRAINDTTPTGIGDIPLSMYEGVKAGDIIDQIWYNKNAWITWRYLYKRLIIPSPGTTFYYLYSRTYLDAIVY